MGKWMQKIINPSTEPGSEEHIEIEDLARLADGAVDNEERKRFIRHLNRCKKCYEILQETLTDASADSSAPSRVPWWKSKMAYALAASILVLCLIGGYLVFSYRHQRPPMIVATLNLDQELKDILMENQVLRWEKGERLNRLVAVLQNKGLPVKALDLVVLAKPYYQKKSLFGPKEVLHIRIDEKVAYLQVKEIN
jgi:hypothetical protein